MHNLKDANPLVLVVHESLEDIAIDALKKSKMDIPLLTIGQSGAGKPNVQDVLFDSNAFKLKEPVQV